MEAVRRETAKTGAMGISIDQQGKHKERFSVQEKNLSFIWLWLTSVNTTPILKYLASSQKQPTALTSPQPQTEFAV